MSIIDCMCFSAIIQQSLKTLARRHAAQVDEKAFEDLFEQRLGDDALRIPKGLEANYRTPEDAAQRRIREMIDAYAVQRTRQLEGELFRQRQRLADAERKLQQRTTKSATESRRIATNKVRWCLDKLQDLRRDALTIDDLRVFPFTFAPVVIEVDGERLIRPMRYHCRPQGAPANFDRRYPGLYNARRDNLEGFWRQLFGHRHALVSMSSFFENVALHDFERRPLADGEPERNLVLHFNPQPAVEMQVACLWSPLRASNGATLYGFAAITDEPPPEVAVTGHDRCVVALREKHVGRWLAAAEADNTGYHAMLADRAPLRYSHSRAA